MLINDFCATKSLDDLAVAMKADAHLYFNFFKHYRISLIELTCLSSSRF